MAEKLVTLKLEGDWETNGFHVLLEIGQDGARPDIEAIGTLPPNPALLQQLQDWQQSYRLLDAPSRIKPLEITYVGSLHTVETCHQEAEKLGNQLKSWLRSAPFMPIDQPLREELSPTDTVRLVIRTTNPHLQHLPWHLWDLIDRYPQIELALGTPTLKRLAERPVHHSTVKILAILGDSSGIDTVADRQLLASIPGAEVTFLVEPQRQQITDQLWEQPWDLLFFAGHGRTEAGAGKIFINPQESLTLEELKYGLREAVRQGLQLAIFNACDGLGLANALAPLGLPQMILMREPIPDQVAQTFLKYFLDAYVTGESLYLAARQARERLQGLEDRFPCASWLPIIFQVNPVLPLRWSQLTVTTAGANPSTRSALRPLLKPSVGGHLPLKTLLTLSAVVTASVGILRWTGVLQRPELAAYDQLMRQQPAQTVTQRVLIVEATTEDVNTYGYPLPDQVLAQAIDQLSPHQPRVIGLDIFRPEATPSNPLGQRFQENNVVALCSFGQAGGGNQAGIAPPPELPEEQVGFSNVVIDPDGILRRQLLFAQPDTTSSCTSRTSLAMLTTLHYLDVQGIQLENLDHQRLRLGAATLAPMGTRSGGYQHIDDRGFQILLRYTHAPVAQRITLSELIGGEGDLEDLTDHVVLMGMSAPTSNPTDYFLTPMGTTQWTQTKVPGKVPGIDIHAQTINHLLAAALDEQALLKTMPAMVDWLWIAGWTLIGCGLTVKRRPWILWLLGLGIGTLALYGISFWLFTIGLWVPLVPGALALVGAAGGAAVIPQGQKTSPQKAD
ncbi:CHASE2 domain-containing protein [Leptothoe sp. PORK10 BA2]|uniref:CHASE2 domain-containing protein n=1 Tax=Leptothoe sp. PORK10 BA2 TaxID=3110254 RepID=UPI002B1F7527|nr:CHASE2 domain-containing protein [Leptothoe sp. PORK10 BA2]MEA5463740.1 CHASE2 domain-containing protein [Leptothoe sp. PORK10 BA2]